MLVKPFLEGAGTLPVTSRETFKLNQRESHFHFHFHFFPLVSHFGSIMSAYLWKSFDEDEDRPEKPRRYGVTEMRGPHFTLLSQNVIQVILMMIVFIISANHDLIIYNNYFYFLLDGFWLLGNYL